MDYPLDHTIDDSQKIRIRRIKAGSLFKLVAVAAFSVFIPLFGFFGILALFGFRTVFVNHHQVYGIEGLIAALIMAPMFSMIISVLGWVALYVGIVIWGHFQPITISYVSADEPKA
jgi:hypothetical protein